MLAGFFLKPTPPDIAAALGIPWADNALVRGSGPPRGSIRGCQVAQSKGAPASAEGPVLSEVERLYVV